MLTLDEIRARMTSSDDSADVDRAFADFSQQTGSDDLYAFLAWLKKRGELDPETFLEVHASEPVRCSVEAVGDPFGDDGPTRMINLGQVGAGGAGEVFIARDEKLGRKVAVKVLRFSDPRKQERMMRRFVHEAQITAQLEHPNIVPVYRLRPQEDGSLAYSMKLIRGQTFAALFEAERERVGREGSDYEDTALLQRLEYFVKICDAMAYAHDRGVLHRDLKPQNLMLGPFHEVYVMDWGIAKVLSSESDLGLEQAEEPDGSSEPPTLPGPKGEVAPELTRAGQILGTPRYMSPEQGRGQLADLDARADVASLGLILYELVSLRTAREVDDIVDLLMMVEEAEPGPMTHAVDGVSVSDELWAIVDKAIHPERDERYPTAEALAADIRAFLRNEAVSARPDNLLQATMRWLSRHRQWTFILLLASLLGVAAVATASAVRQRRAAVKALHRERRLEAFLTQVSHNTLRLEATFFGVEVRLTRFAVAVREAYLRGEPSGDPVYLATDYADESRRPKALRPSEHYGEPVSLTHPHFALPPGASREDEENRMRRLAPIRHEMTDAIVSSRELSPSTRGMDERAARDYALGHGLPIDRVYFGSARGMLVEMPGQYWDTKGYDPRVRPWYRLGEKQHGFRFGNPFVETATEALLISCSTGVWSEDDAFVGTAGVGLAVRYLVDELMAVDDPAVISTYLIDDEDRVVVSTEDSRREVELGALDKIEGLRPYPHAAELASAGDGARAGESGTVRLGSGPDAKLLVVQPLSSTGWRYVVEARLQTLLQ